MENRSMENRVMVILPVYMEEEGVGKVIDEIRQLGPNCMILAAYTPGADGTEDVLAWKGVPWLTVPEKGKGIAVRKAFQFAGADYIMMIDADYTYPARSLSFVLNRLKAGADVVMGYRKDKEDGAMPAVNAFGNWALSLLASVLYRVRVHDVCTGLWGFRREELDKFRIESEGFTLEAELFVSSVRSGCRLEQIPIGYRKRLGGSKPKLKVMDGVKIGWFLIRKRFQ